jgi:hypothetical protein
MYAWNVPTWHDEEVTVSFGGRGTNTDDDVRIIKLSTISVKLKADGRCKAEPLSSKLNNRIADFIGLN